MPEPACPAEGCVRRRLTGYLGLATVVGGLDFLTKRWVESALAPGQVIEVTAFFNLVLTFNPGAAFSLFAQASGWQRPLFIGVAVVAAAVITWLLRRHWRDTLFGVALSLILGGALGNLWDRVVLGHVVDFLDFHAAGWHWPAFNLADSAITVGAALLVWDAFRKPAHAVTGDR
jgi:signal peptidase II